MYPDHIALLSVTRIAKDVGGSALPNAPVVDDSFDRLSVGAAPDRGSEAAGGADLAR